MFHIVRSFALCYIEASDDNKMTVRLLLDELLAERGQTAYWLSKRTGIAHPVIHKLRYGKLASIRFDYIERLCAALECEPGDLIVLEKKMTKKR